MAEDYYAPLQSGLTYHVFNQGNNEENLFKEKRNYPYFLKKYKEYISPIAGTFAYCLMPNHFHLLLRFKDYPLLHEAFPKRFPAPPPGLRSATDCSTVEHAAYNELISLAISKQFADFFAGYARAVNKAYQRSGKLFSLPFKRILVDNETYFEWLVSYIHRNPLHHGFCSSFEEWEHSSFREISDAFRPVFRPVSTSSANRSLDEKATRLVSTRSANKSEPGICELEFLQNWYGSYENFALLHQQSVLAMLDRRFWLE